MRCRLCGTGGRGGAPMRAGAPSPSSHRSSISDTLFLGNQPCSDCRRSRKPWYMDTSWDRTLVTRTRSPTFSARRCGPVPFGGANFTLQTTSGKSSSSSSCCMPSSPSRPPWPSRSPSLASAPDIAASRAARSFSSASRRANASFHSFSMRCADRSTEGGGGLSQAWRMGGRWPFCCCSRSMSTTSAAEVGVSVSTPVARAAHDGSTLCTTARGTQPRRPLLSGRQA
mmetsp:Transcript_51165/g.137743  ORF Transcript_51165/g.137743 Transcript_51165/m.137743 type:complete len:227 (-) Transcript_51165:436-1116(-)